MINKDARYLRSKSGRAELYFKAEGNCEYCKCELGDGWHADHYQPWKHGGKTVFSNMRASCEKCNLKKGSKIMSEIEKTPSYYENLKHFENDFPKCKSMRVCQKGAYNCLVEKLGNYNLLDTDEKKACSIFLPTGSGKSDVCRMAAIGLVQKRKTYSGVFVFSPSIGLRSQLAKNNREEFFERLDDWPEKNSSPFMESDNLENPLRNGAVLNSMTIQFLTQEGNVDLFIKMAEFQKRKTGKPVLAIFDESHLCSNENEWGKSAIRLQKAGIPIVLITGTPFRADNLQIPGFIMEEPDEIIEKDSNKYGKVDDTTYYHQKDHIKVSRYKLKADYAYSYSRAWEDKIILKPIPLWCDATETTNETLLSEMKNDRFLRDFLTSDATIKEAVKKCIDSLRTRKSENSYCSAIVASLSDESEERKVADDINYDDIHAKKIKREFERQSPDLKVLVVTSKTNPVDGLEKFKKENYDVLIVKAMGTIGFDCSKIKTVVQLSNIRTLPAFIQLANRGCRILNHSKFAHFDLIMPVDMGMKKLWDKFLAETGLTVEHEEVISSEYEEKQIKEKDSKEKDKEELCFENHTWSADHITGRNKNDEIFDFFRKYMPEISNSLDPQKQLNHHEFLVSIGGENYMEKAKNAPVEKKILLDCNEEERRLRQEANDVAAEITREIISILDDYSPALFGSIQSEVWTCIKRCCGFRPAQTLTNLAGIDNYKNLIEKGKRIKARLLMVRENSEFDYKDFLRKKMCK